MNFANKTFILCISALVSLSPHTAFADTVLETKKFDNSFCDLNDTCDLESFYVKTISTLKNEQGQTYMSSGFKTTSNQALKNYAIVQFHQGCMYHDTSPIKFLNRTYMGIDGVPFVHPEMAIDSAPDADPIYQSSPRGGQDDGFGYIYPRKEYYFIFEPQFNSRNAPQDSYMNHLGNNEVTQLHVSDVPTFADLNDNKIASLKFVTCLYKIKDIPAYIDDQTSLPLSNAIKCFDWNHNWKRNHLNELERTQEIDPVCLQGEM